MGQRLGPEAWNRGLGQRLESEAWPRGLGQRLGPKGDVMMVMSDNGDDGDDGDNYDDFDADKEEDEDKDEDEAQGPSLKVPRKRSQDASPDSDGIPRISEGPLFCPRSETRSGRNRVFILLVTSNPVWPCPSF